MFDRCYGCMERLSYPDEPCPYCGYNGRARTFDRNHLPPGSVLQGRYVLGTALGLGGFGNTYIGWDPQTQMRVTVKEFLPSALACHRADTLQVQFYSDEGRAAFEKGLQSFCSQSDALRRMPEAACINPILDIVQANGTAYTVMQYLHGQTLKAYLAEVRVLPFEQAMEILTPVLRTLDIVHRNGLLHRDICPDNIFLCDDGQVRILDFGVAQYDLIPDSGESLSVMFKPGFAPPEQYMRHLLPGPWTDVYGVAATLYKMISGIPPADVPQRQREDHLLPPHELDCDIPQEAEKALLRALSLRPENRYATAEAFLKALGGGADPEEDEESAGPDARQILIAVLAAVVVLIVAVGVVLIVSHRGGDEATTVPPTGSAGEVLSAGTDLPDEMTVTYYEGFAPQSMEIVRTTGGDPTSMPYAVFVSGGRRGLVSAQGEIVLPAQYNSIAWDSASQSFLLDGKTLWDVSGGTAVSVQPEQTTQAGGDPASSVYTYDGSSHVLYRVSGGEKYVQKAAEGSFLVGSGPYGIVTRGTLLADPVYEKAMPLSCGISAVCRDGQWTYINTFGMEVPGYSPDASAYPLGVPFSFGDALAPFYDAESGLWGYINTGGDTIVSARFRSALPPSQYTAWVQTDDGFGTVSFAPQSVKEDMTGGKCGENIQYTYTPRTGLLEIDGYGSLWDFTADNVPWLSVRRQIRTVRILGDIDYIGACSFYGCSALTDVTVTGALRAVGPFAFEGCGNLRMFSVSDSLESIGDLAFAHCSAMTDLPLGMLRTLGVYAFAGSGIQSLSIREQADLSVGCFSDCTALQTADLSGVLRIGASAFSGCTALQTVTMPSGMEQIGASAFSGCTTLESIRVPPGVQTVSEETFRDCTALQSVTLPDGLRTIGTRAFAGCASLGAVSLPPTLTKISTYAFENCVRLRNVTVPTSVSEIDAYAFAHCTGITSIELKDSVKKLGAHAFEGWTSSQTIRVQNVLLKRLLGMPSGWDDAWNAGCSAQIVSV